MHVSRGSVSTWALAAVAAVLQIGGSVYLSREEWRNELAAAQSAADADVERLSALLGSTLRLDRDADLAPLLQSWGRTEPTLALLRVEAANGAVLGEFTRADLRGEKLTHVASIAYGAGGDARLTLVTDLTAAEARRARFAMELALADVVIGVAIIVVSLLLVAVRNSARRYRTLLAANELLLGGASAPDLLRNVCKVAAREGAFRLAWIGLLERGPFLEPTAAAGPAIGYLEGLQVSADASLAEGRGPGGIAFRTGRTFVSNDFLDDPATAVWSARARRFGIRAVAALPLTQNGQLRGILGLYSGERGHFDKVEVALVEQLAADISLGLEHLRRGAELEQSLAQLRQIESTVRAGAYRFELPGRTLWCSAGAGVLLGRPEGDQQVADAETTADGRDPAVDLLDLAAAAANTGSDFEFDLPVVIRGASVRWLRVAGVRSRREEGALEVRGMLQDISERKSLEVELTRAADRERQRLASELHDNLGQVLTGASLLVGAAERHVPPGADALRADIARANELLKDSLDLCRTLAHDTAPFLAGGLGASLENLAARSTTGDIRCDASIAPAARALAGEQALELYRIAQEAVTNALKHSRCTRIWIEVAVRGHILELSVRDDGVGFGPANPDAEAGLGQRTMRYRAARAGGTIVLRNAPQGGATVQVRVRRFSG
jgi:signal transduction histidine kinase